MQLYIYIYVCFFPCNKVRVNARAGLENGEIAGQRSVDRRDDRGPE